MFRNFITNISAVNRLIYVDIGHKQRSTAVTKFYEEDSTRARSDFYIKHLLRELLRTLEKRQLHLQLP